MDGLRWLGEVNCLEDAWGSWGGDRSRERDSEPDSEPDTDSNSSMFFLPEVLLFPPSFLYAAYGYDDLEDFCQGLVAAKRKVIEPLRVTEW